MKIKQLEAKLQSLAGLDTASSTHLAVPTDQPTNLIKSPSTPKQQVVKPTLQSGQLAFSSIARSPTNLTVPSSNPSIPVKSPTASNQQTAKPALQSGQSSAFSSVVRSPTNKLKLHRNTNNQKAAAITPNKLTVSEKDSTAAPQSSSYTVIKSPLQPTSSSVSASKSPAAQSAKTLTGLPKVKPVATGAAVSVATDQRAKRKSSDSTESDIIKKVKTETGE